MSNDPALDPALDAASDAASDAAPDAPDAAPGAAPAKRSRKKTKEKGYASYLAKVFKKLHADKKYTISSKAMTIVNDMIENMEGRVANRAFQMAKFNKKSTLSAKHIAAAAKLVLPPEMSGVASGEGAKAVGKFLAKA